MSKIKKIDEKFSSLLTTSEWLFYDKKLRPFLEKYDYKFFVCPKVRLADLISAEELLQKHISKFYSMHIDFVVCDANFHVLFLVEYDDDGTHQNSGNDRLKDAWCNTKYLKNPNNPKEKPQPIYHLFRIAKRDDLSAIETFFAENSEKFKLK